MNAKKKLYYTMVFFQLFLIFMVIFSVNGLITMAAAQSDSSTSNDPGVSIALAFSAAIAVGLAVIGSAWAIKTVGTAAISSLIEREESFFKAFLIVALGEALAVYGLIVAILLWTKI